ncbi:MAG: hypothetical protein DME21_13115 [Verrucomicrobia bacterium]|nr:MAG: hypothetical protein DME21_13115 [Verrucomicrobiota bacterium]
MIEPVSTSTNVFGDEATTATLPGLVVMIMDGGNGRELTMRSAGRITLTGSPRQQRAPDNQRHRPKNSDNGESAAPMVHPAPTPHGAQRAVPQRALEIRRRGFGQHVVEQKAMF